MSAPIIGITPDISEGRLRLSPAYGEAVTRAGGLPIVLCPVLQQAAAMVDRCDGLILSGGDDPIMETWGRPTHPNAVKVDPPRQAFDLAVYHAACKLGIPVLGICLGMQIMGLEAGGDLDQHLPDSLKTASEHAGGRMHEVSGSLGAGEVHSRHHQALRTAGTFDIAATAHDGLIEAIADPTADFLVGVQWHPERSSEGPMGSELFERLVAAAIRHQAAVEGFPHAAS